MWKPGNWAGNNPSTTSLDQRNGRPYGTLQRSASARITPRSSSLNLAAANTSSASLAGQLRRSESGRRAGTPPIRDPLEVLGRILGRDDFPKPNLGETEIEKPDILDSDVDFGGLSLEEYVEKEEDPANNSGIDYTAHTIEECEMCPFAIVYGCLLVL